GQVILGQTASQTLRIRNQGTEPLNIAGISVDSTHFSVDSTGTATTLASGEWTTFMVTAAPTAGGTQSGTISILSNDADEGTFEIGVVAEVAIPTVAGTIFEDGDASGDHGLGESALPGFSVFLDANDNDIFDVDLQTFENTTQTAIPDAGSMTSEIEVTGMVGNLFDINVGLNITHTWDSDLIATLIAPDNTRIELFNRIGGNGDNFTDTIFDDQADTSINDGAAPFTGTFRPNEPLSNFAGDPNGIWQLEVSDNANFDTGTLDSWSIEVSTGEDSVPVDAAGQFALLDLPVGDHTVRVIPAPGNDWPTVSPATGEYSYTVSEPTDSFIGQDFGLAKADRFYANIFNDLDGDGDVDPDEAPLHDWTLFIDSNDNGIFEPPVESAFVNGTDAAITDNATVTSEIETSGVDAVIADIDVRLEIEHTFAADLEVTLVAPDGTSVLLFADEGGGGDNFTGTIIDDDASQSITEGAAPFTGRFRPENPLSAFDGKDGNGTWRLEVFDDAGGDTGTLLEWELVITALGEESVMTNDAGHAHHDLPAGTHTISVVGQTDWEFTVPAGGSHSATTDGSPLTANRFGARPVNGVGGDIIVNTLWDNTDEPYRLVSDLRVREGATLTIAEGVTVETANPDFELHLGTETQTGSLIAEETTFNVGLVIQPGSSADLDEGSFAGGDVEVFGSLRASEVLFDANLMTKPGSDVDIRFGSFAPNKVFEFDSAAVLTVFHSDFSAASENSVQAIGVPSDTISMVGNWWGTTDSTGIGNIVLDRLDDDTRPLMEVSDPLIVTPTLGDANGDGRLTNADISGFLLALTDPSGYEGAFPDVDPDIVLDMNWSGSLTNADIAGFLAKLTGN
ncbi:MAG: proprotein convertase P-domain-containing protein, partial [Planctomycetota bacterium]